MNNLMFTVHTCFEKFVVKNKLDFSLVRDPNIKALNNYIENDTAQIFDVFAQGFRSAIEYQLTQGKSG
ncbi:hypothetical protein GYW75_02060 [Gilliamella sp. ESL0232]|uniref:hypothetical protein n=1 Tax=Gilliamella sp. ESL0232 TaxID=2705037 RepID=UPI00158101A1|nr:hypothetical protein [Gilliamella sp. ESL0232]NUE95176.1 hypothetical protein [Gilliamella sp. ESL0232]